MTTCNQQLLGAYHDGELPAAERPNVEAHLRGCDRCASELAQLQAISRLLEAPRGGDLTSAELDRLHHAVDSATRKPALRIAAAITAVAASVLIISAVWLAEISNRPDSPNSAVVARSAEAWETVAATLAPTPADMVEGGHEPATAKAAFDESMLNWMLNGTSPEAN